MHYTLQHRVALLVLFVLIPLFLYSQSDDTAGRTEPRQTEPRQTEPRQASPDQGFTREACIRYAIDHNPLLQQSLIDQQIAQKDIANSLSGWLPQVVVDAGLTNNIDKPNIVFPNEQGEPVVREIGVTYQSNATLTANQTLFSNEVLSAARAAPLVRLQASQNTYADKIDLYVEVSKAFFDLLTTQDQISILSEDLQRLQKNVKDARSRYENGIADPVDYKQATIQLNNTRAQLVSAQELLPYRRAVLKQRMGYPQDQPLEITYDPDQLREEATLDTLRSLSYRNRIEYSLIETQAGLLSANVSRYRWGFLPRVSAFFNYQFGYFNEQFDPLYDRSFTSSQVGLRASIPLFQGASRIYDLQAAKLEAERLGYARTNLQYQIETEYAQAVATYRGAYTNWQLQQENEQLAREVYQTIRLQYDEGIIPYLEVIQAETDLRSAQLNTSNALLRVLSSKVDVQRANGTVPIGETTTNE